MIRRCAPITLCVVLVLGLLAVAAAAPVGDPIATRGVTAWWTATEPAQKSCKAMCPTLSGRADASVLLTCCVARGHFAGRAAQVIRWEWAPPPQETVRPRCPGGKWLKPCPKLCKAK